jgi:GntR family transcriptional regulator
MLEEDRVIRTRHGSGRFLLSSPSDLDFDIARLQSVTEMLEGHDIHSTVRVIGVTEQPANAETAIHLEIDEGTPVLRIERCRSVGDTPIIYSIDTLESRHFTNGWSPDDFKGSLLDHLKDNYDLQLNYSHALIKIIPGSELASAGVYSDPDVPWILLIQTNYNQLGDPIIFSHDYHRSDSVTFHVRRLRY